MADVVVTGIGRICGWIGVRGVSGGGVLGAWHGIKLGNTRNTQTHLSIRRGRPTSSTGAATVRSLGVLLQTRMRRRGTGEEEAWQWCKAMPQPETVRPAKVNLLADGICPDAKEHGHG